MVTLLKDKEVQKPLILSAAIVAATSYLAGILASHYGIILMTVAN